MSTDEQEPSILSLSFSQAWLLFLQPHQQQSLVSHQEIPFNALVTLPQLVRFKQNPGQHHLLSNQDPALVGSTPQSPNTSGVNQPGH